MGVAADPKMQFFVWLQTWQCFIWDWRLRQIWL